MRTSEDERRVLQEQITADELERHFINCSAGQGSDGSITWSWGRGGDGISSLSPEEDEEAEEKEAEVDEDEGKGKGKGKDAVNGYEG